MKEQQKYFNNNVIIELKLYVIIFKYMIKVWKSNLIMVVYSKNEERRGYRLV